MAVALFMALCLPSVHATPIEEIRYGVPPTNARWDNDKMLWESDYLTTAPDNYFDGFQIDIRYTTDEDGQNVAESDWEYLYSYQTFRSYPSLGDFSIPASGWYSFRVRAYGEHMEDSGAGYVIAYDYVSDWSDWAEVQYFETAEKLPMPTDLYWEGSTMHWTVADITNVQFCQVSVCYLENGTEETATSWWEYPQYKQTRFSLSLEEIGLDEEWLVANGSQSYYFKVMCYTNNATVAANSSWAVCAETIEFNAGATKLDEPMGLNWDNYTMTWTVEEGATYDVRLWFQRTELTPEEEAELGAAGGSSEEIFSPYVLEEYTGITGNGDWPQLNNDVLHHQKGDYWFEVRACSTDLSKHLSSDWSAPSWKKSMDGPLTLNIPIWLVWQHDDADTLSWTWEAPAAQQSYLRGYRVEVYYKENSSDSAVKLGSFDLTGASTSTSKWKQYANKDGYYSARVCADTTDYSAFDCSDYSEFSSDYWYDAPDPLPAPIGLSWAGSVATWTPVGDAADVARYMVSLYYYGTDGNANPTFCTSWSVSNEDSQLLFTEDQFSKKGEGVYCFSVYATSSNPDSAADSVEVTSGPFTYTVPNAALAAPTGMYWDNNYMKWDIPSDTTGIGGYEINYYGDGYPRGYTTEVAIGEFPVLGEWNVEQLGDNISFRVRALTDNVSANKNSDWAACSTNYVPPEGLPVPTNIRWDGTTMRWDWEGDESLFSNFIVEVYYAASAGAEPVYLSTLGTIDKYMDQRAWAADATQPGVYYFNVMARSLDTDQIAHSKQSDLSPGQQYEPVEPLPAPTNMRWDGSEIVWDVPAEELLNCIDEYVIDLYKEGANYNIARYYVMPYAGRYHISTNVFENNGAGTYTFSIRAVSSDPSQYATTGFISSRSYFTFTGFKSDLPAPTNLRWEGSTAKWDALDYGTVNFYEVTFTGSNEDRVYTYTVPFGQFPTLSANRINNLGENIHFQVRALSGNANQYGDGQWAFCNTPLVLELEKMTAPTNPVWVDGAMTWSWRAGSDLQAEYRDVFSVQIFYGATEDAEPELVGVRGVMGSNYTGWTQLAKANGWYYFRVNMCSVNSSVVLESDWSVMSDGYYYEQPDPVAPATNVHWENGTSTIVWTASESGYNVARQYRVELYYVDGSGVAQHITTRYETNTQNLTTLRHTIPTSFFERTGSGTYRIAIVATPRDSLAYSNSTPAWSEDYIYSDPGKQLDMPTNLRWEGDTAKWDVPEDASAIAFYQVEFISAANPAISYKQELAPGEFAKVDSFYLGQLGNTIEFSVCAVSRDANVASDSNWGLCNDYFVYAPAPLPTPTGLEYNEKIGKLNWTAVENADAYTVEVWFTGEDTDEEILYDAYDVLSAGLYFSPEVEGSFRFTVQAFSQSVLWEPSAWSNSCEYVYRLIPVEEVSEIISQISGMDTAEAVESVKAINTSSLATAMTESSTVLEGIKALEEKLDVAQAINVTESVEQLFALDTMPVELVGAAFNADSGETVTLHIQEKSDTMPEVNKNTYASSVSFSMHLEVNNVKHTGALSIPVLIKLPVPKGMNPSLLKILHYHDGSDQAEIILPEVTLGADGQWYAAFTITSFSDFALANTMPDLLTAKISDKWTVALDEWYQIPTGSVGILALYDDVGKLIGVTSGDTLYDSVTCTVKPTSAKLLLVDGTTWTPLYTETPCRIK